jgi:hypothetical protein
MPVTQERLLGIIVAAERIIKQHEALHKRVRELVGLLPTDFANQQEVLPSLLIETLIEPTDQSLILSEIAHFRIHFRRNERRAVRLRINRENQKSEDDSQTVNEYFTDGAAEEVKETEVKETETEIETSTKVEVSDETCPICGAKAKSDEGSKHSRDCSFYQG